MESRKYISSFWNQIFFSNPLFLHETEIQSFCKCLYKFKVNSLRKFNAHFSQIKKSI